MHLNRAQKEDEITQSGPRKKKLLHAIISLDFNNNYRRNWFKEDEIIGESSALLLSLRILSSISIIMSCHGKYKLIISISFLYSVSNDTISTNIHLEPTDGNTKNSTNIGNHCDDVNFTSTVDYRSMLNGKIKLKLSVHSARDGHVSRHI